MLRCTACGIWCRACESCEVSTSRFGDFLSVIGDFVRGAKALEFWRNGFRVVGFIASGDLTLGIRIPQKPYNSMVFGPKSLNI